MKFTQLLNESTIPQDILKKFGKILFGSFQNKERDTPYEDKLFIMVVDWVNGTYDSGNKMPDVTKKFKELLKLKKYYPELVPNSNNLFRAVMVDTNMHDYLLNNIVGYDKKTKTYTVDPNIKYKPHASVQSWSPNINNYVKKNFQNQPYIIINAKFKNDTLLFDMKFLNRINRFLGFKLENEIIRIDKSPVNGNIKIVDKSDQLEGYTNWDQELDDWN